MGKPFTVNVNRFDPYKSYRFLVYFGTSTSPVAAVSKVGALKRSSDVIEYKSGGDPISRKGLGRTKYEPITLERVLTQDTEFEVWANLVNSIPAGPSMSPVNFRKDIVIELLDEQGTTVKAYKVYRCWVCEYEALPELEADALMVPIERMVLQNEGWERDTSAVG